MSKIIAAFLVCLCFMVPGQVYSAPFMYMNEAGEWETYPTVDRYGDHDKFIRIDPKNLFDVKITRRVPSISAEYPGDGVTDEFYMPFSYSVSRNFIGLINDSTGEKIRWTRDVEFSLNGRTLYADVAPAIGYTLRMVENLEGDLRGLSYVEIHAASPINDYNARVFSTYEPTKIAEMVSLIESALVYKVPNEIIRKSYAGEDNIIYYISVCNNKLFYGKSISNGNYYHLVFSASRVSLKTLADYEKVKTEFQDLQDSPATQAACANR